MNALDRNISPSDHLIILKLTSLKANLSYLILTSNNPRQIAYIVITIHGRPILNSISLLILQRYEPNQSYKRLYKYRL